MAADLESRARDLLLRLGSVPTDPSDARAFVQRRVRMYLGVVLAIWTGVFLFDRVVTFAFTGRFFFQALPSTIVHGIVMVMLAALYAVSRSGERAVVTMGIVELVATIGQSIATSRMFAAVPVALRPDLMMVLVVTHVLVLRAAIVPGTPRRSVGVGLLASAPVIVTSAIMHVGLPDDPTKPPKVLMTVGIVLWCLIAITVTTAIAAIIYGLRERMLAAMKLGQYTLLEKVGEGGMGAVFRAKHTLLRRPTAVKVLASDNAGAAMIARFEREVQLTSEIAHPNVVSVYDYGRSADGSFYYAMEYLDGLDLQRVVRKDGPLPPSRVVYVLAQVAEALAEAHSVGLIHRDIKPANIVLCAHSRRPDLVKVVDFGLVKQVGTEDPALSGENTITGTPLYMPPEALVSPNEVDARSDLYSLGAVAYYLLTGEPVFNGTTLLEVCAATLHEPVVPPSKRAGVAIPADLEALVMACLAKSKSDRPANAEAVLERLRACDVGAVWSADDARRWWERHADDVPAVPESDRMALTRTLAVAPRSSAP